MKTYEQWRESTVSFPQFANPGDIVEEAIVMEFLNGVPPHVRESNFIQCGEPYGHVVDKRTDILRGTFMTFQRRYGQWYYCENCFIRENIEPNYDAYVFLALDSRKKAGEITNAS